MHFRLFDINSIKSFKIYTFLAREARAFKLFFFFFFFSSSSFSLYECLRKICWFSSFLQFTLLKYDESTLLQCFLKFFLSILKYFLTISIFFFCRNVFPKLVHFSHFWDLLCFCMIKVNFYKSYCFMSYCHFHFFLWFSFFQKIVILHSHLSCFQIRFFKMFCKILNFKLSCCNILKVFPRLFTIYKHFFSKIFFIWHFTTFFFALSGKLILFLICSGFFYFTQFDKKSFFS